VFALFFRRDHANSSYQRIDYIELQKKGVTRRAGPQLARYSINTTAVPGSVSPRSVSLTARSSINQALRV
jgi:hypothetical protein